MNALKPREKKKADNHGPGFPALLPDEGLQDEGRGPLLELQLFVVEGLGVGSALGSPLPQQHDAIIVPQGQRALAAHNTAVITPPAEDQSNGAHAAAIRGNIGTWRARGEVTIIVAAMRLLFPGDYFHVVLAPARSSLKRNHTWREPQDLRM